MMDKNVKALLLKLRELKADNHDLEVIVDLQREDIADRDEMILSLKGQLQNLRIDRTYAVG